MFGQRDIFDYAKTFFILAICFGIVGNNIYFENVNGLIDKYNYHDEPLNSLFHMEYNNLVLEGGHDYTFCFYVEGPQGAILNIDMIFETMDNISLSYDTSANETWSGYWGEDRVYSEPLYIPENESIDISVHLTTSSYVDGIHWQILIYQDLPNWLTKSSLLIAFTIILLLVIWAISFEQYEKTLTDIEKQKRKLEKEKEEGKMSNENMEEKSNSVPTIGKNKLKLLISHPKFNIDFRQTPINWFLIILSTVFLIFVIYTDGFIFQVNDRWYFMIGIPIFIVIFIFLILTQGQWQRFKEYDQRLDVAAYTGFIVIGFITLFFYNILFSLTVMILIWMFRRYLVTRENRLVDKGYKNVFSK